MALRSRFPIHAIWLAVFASLTLGTASLAAAKDEKSATGVDEARFLAKNAAAMTRMMIDMAVEPSGDVDRDFVAMMAPHHQGAIDMALTVLRYGHNEQIRRLAQEIIVTQQQEIVAMRLAIGDPLPPSVPSPTQILPVPAAAPKPMPIGATAMSHHSMEMK